MQRKIALEQCTAPALKAQLTPLPGIKLLLFDVYGTIFYSDKEPLWQIVKGEWKIKIDAFEKTVREFGLRESLRKLDAKKKPAVTLLQLYESGIEAEHRRKHKQGIKYPEVRIETIWCSIIKKALKNGYKFQKHAKDLNEFSYRIAYFCNHVRQLNRLYKNAFGTLAELRSRGYKLGIVSNSQFYTQIDLTLQLQRFARIKSWHDIFEKRYSNFSFEVGFSKPNPKIFQRVLHNAKKASIARNQIAFIGNDLINDIVTAKKLGPRAILFAGDRHSIKGLHGKKMKTKPDAIISNWKQLLHVLP